MCCRTWRISSRGLSLGTKRSSPTSSPGTGTVIASSAAVRKERYPTFYVPGQCYRNGKPLFYVKLATKWLVPVRRVSQNSSRMLCSLFLVVSKGIGTVKPVFSYLGTIVTVYTKSEIFCVSSSNTDKTFILIYGDFRLSAGTRSLRWTLERTRPGRRWSPTMSRQRDSRDLSR